MVLQGKEVPRVSRAGVSTNPPHSGQPHHWAVQRTPTPPGMGWAFTASPYMHCRSAKGSHDESHNVPLFKTELKIQLANIR